MHKSRWFYMVLMRFWGGSRWFWGDFSVYFRLVMDKLPICKLYFSPWFVSKILHLSSLSYGPTIQVLIVLKPSVL